MAPNASLEEDRAAQRAGAVAEALDRLRTLLPGEPASAGALGEAEGVVRALAAQAALWPAEDFPIPAGKLWHAYTLHEDADGRYAVYAVPMHPGHAQPPHDHTTWAVIAGVRGAERNVLFERPLPGGEPAPLVPRADVVVSAGRSLSIGPAELHAIEVLGPDDALHLHVYGRGFAHLQARRIFDPHTGAQRPFPPLS